MRYLWTNGFSLAIIEILKHSSKQSYEICRWAHKTPYSFKRAQLKGGINQITCKKDGKRKEEQWVCKIKIEAKGKIVEED